MTEWMQQLRLTLRTLWKAPAFTIPAVLLLGLGVGGVTTVFTVADHVLLRPLPYPEADRLVRIGEGAVSGPVIQNLRELDSFDALAIADSEPGNLTGRQNPVQVEQAIVSRDFFSFFGARPSVGRLLVADDFSAADAAVLSHQSWERLFGGEPSVVGSSVRLDGQPVTIVGVLSADFVPPPKLVSAAVDVWRPVDWSRDRNRRPDYAALKVAGRLGPGVSQSAAQAELDALAERLARRYPENRMNSDGSAQPLPMVGLHEATVRGIRASLGLLLGGVALLLLIACLNVAHLFFARGLGRAREMAVRRALGASTRGLVKQLLVESLLVGLAGACIGLVVASVSLDVLLAMRPATLPVAVDVDLRILAFAAAVGTVTAVVFGLVPGVRALGSGLTSELRGSSRGATEGVGTKGFRDGMIVAETALSLVLIALTGVLIQSFTQLQSTDSGFDPENLWTIPLFPTAESSALDYHEAMDRVAASLEDVTGVESATYGLLMPFEMTGSTRCCWNYRRMIADGRVRGDVRVIQQAVSANYFETLGVPLLAGSSWSDYEPGQTPVPTVLSERLAVTFFGSAERALGREILRGENGMEIRVVGVADDTRHYGLDQPVPQFMYLPSWTVGYGFGRAHFAVRVDDQAPVRLVSSLREAVWRTLPNIPVPTVRRMTDWMEASTAPRQFNWMVFGSFGLVALILAAAGLYGTLLYHVKVRRREMGIRLALGADPARLEGGIVWAGVQLALIGSAVGLVAAWAAGRIFQHSVTDLTTPDPLTLVIATSVLLLVAAAASWLPARRAGRTNPVESLRADSG